MSSPLGIIIQFYLNTYLIFNKMCTVPSLFFSEIEGIDNRRISVSS